MFVSNHLLLACICSIAYFVRVHSSKNYPIRRYHPTTYFTNQNDEPDTAADNIQYAYEGGESHTGEVMSPHQNTNFKDMSYKPKPEIPSISYQADASHDLYQSVSGHDNNQYQGASYHEDSGAHDKPNPSTDHDSSFHEVHADIIYEDHDPSFFKDHEAGFHEDHDYSYDIPVHDHPPSPGHGYHYLPPDPGLTAPAEHPLVEMPKLTQPQVTYYYLGRHLWYIPLYFSIYFIIYVGALVLKAVARHKIQFPYNLQMTVDHARAAKSLEEASKKFLM